MTTGLDEKQAKWYRMPAADVLAGQAVTPDRGLTDAEVQARQARYGPNVLVERGLKSPVRIFAEQFADVMVLILIAAAGVSALVKDLLDGAIILAIVVLNAILGFVQEYRAERAMAALKEMAAPVVKVRRGGQVRTIPSQELVPGDIVLLEAGSAIPADLRLFETANLRVQEASLTGESLAVDKISDAIGGAEHVPLGDRRNMAYMGTAVTYGRGAGVAVETGMATELGRIAELIQSVSTERTPLQRRMEQLGRALAVAALVIVAVVFSLGLLRGEDPVEMLLTAIAMAVAAVPEGLPAVVTIALALGAQRMLKRNALVRKLPAVETLGSVTVICSDKTGTLTENRMAARLIAVDGQTFDVSEGSTPDLPPAARLLLAAGALANDAVLQPAADGERAFEIVGDPTEGALLEAAHRAGVDRALLDGVLPRIGEVPFSSERKRMTTVHRVEGGLPAEVAGVPGFEGAQAFAFAKGAVDHLLGVAGAAWSGGEVRPLNDDLRAAILAENDRHAADGLRVLGVAARPLDGVAQNGSQWDWAEDDLIFLGMVGLIDPPRPEAAAAVATAKAAGVRPVMITGDHPLTALTIAQELGIAEGERLLTGSELQSMSEAELEAVVDDVAVYARVSPEHKLNIVSALQARGHIVAMTGDGVNDAPALRRGDIGVAMGITGTDVSKEASDMVLLDDNFATIVRALEEGRTIYDNIRKFIKYTLTSNAGEIYVMLLAPFVGMPLPLTALQILWINLVTDGLPGLAMAVEPTERDVMRRKPFAPDENILGRGLGRHVLWVGLLMGLISLGVGLWGWSTGRANWQTMVFTTLTLAQMGHALAVRSRESLFRVGLFSNRALLGAVALTFVLQMGVVYLPPMQRFFDTGALSALELGVSLGAALSVFAAVEVEKWLTRRSEREATGRPSEPAPSRESTVR